MSGKQQNVYAQPSVGSNIAKHLHSLLQRFTASVLQRFTASLLINGKFAKSIQKGPSVTSGFLG